MPTERLDVALAARGLSHSREKARAAIKAGAVLVDGVVCDKPSRLVGDAQALVLLEQNRYVGRGGYKLESALERFALDVTGLRALDIGASTGGFTDCLLQRGAACVTAVDVGHGQLADKLASDPRVTSMEGVNARELSLNTFALPFDAIVIDVSFISLLHILPAAMSCLVACGFIVALIKPQFEAGPSRVGKNGVVKDRAAHADALNKVIVGAEAIGLHAKAAMRSPILGGEGNAEFLTHFAPVPPRMVTPENIRALALP